MISNKGSQQAEQAGINVNDAQQLPARCGQHVNLLACISSPPNSKTSADESAGVLLFPSHTIIITIAIYIGP
ncbi:putative lipid binding protein [Corchorus olitorius]|uniref:Lipid binding protein n=1 Tax=Corchorus olitorius TaxID=93759 RepID=A0A1R3JWK4_9ROSI|nr:putative lipid binding protein [Corchorus olitorius]